MYLRYMFYRFAADATHKVVSVNDIPAGWMGLDIGTSFYEYILAYLTTQVVPACYATVRTYSMGLKWAVVSGAPIVVICCNIHNNNYTILFKTGPQTVQELQAALADCKTVIWNGPMGVFEFEAFAHGTNAIATTLAGLTEKGCVTIIGECVCMLFYVLCVLSGLRYCVECRT